MSKKQAKVAGKRYRAMGHINTEPHTNPGDEFNPELVSDEALTIFLAIGIVIEETGEATTGENDGKEINA